MRGSLYTLPQWHNLWGEGKCFSLPLLWHTSGQNATFEFHHFWKNSPVGQAPDLPSLILLCHCNMKLIPLCYVGFLSSCTSSTEVSLELFTSLINGYTMLCHYQLITWQPGSNSRCLVIVVSQNNRQALNFTVGLSVKSVRIHQLSFHTSMFVKW